MNKPSTAKGYKSPCFRSISPKSAGYFYSLSFACFLFFLFFFFSGFAAAYALEPSYSFCCCSYYSTTTFFCCACYAGHEMLPFSIISSNGKGARSKFSKWASTADRWVSGVSLRCSLIKCLADLNKASFSKRVVRWLSYLSFREAESYPM
jgi:hypothetical protein